MRQTDFMNQTLPLQTRLRSLALALLLAAGGLAVSGTSPLSVTAADNAIPEIPSCATLLARKVTFNATTVAIEGEQLTKERSDALTPVQLCSNNVDLDHDAGGCLTNEGRLPVAS